MTSGVVVLAGGASRRMGSDKAARALGGVPALRRVVGALAVVGPVVVVAAAGQPLDPGGAHVVRDEEPGAGPLPALALGLRTAAGLGAGAVVVCAVDTPLVHPAVALALLGRLGTRDVVLPVLDGRKQPLLAAWRTGVAGHVAALAGTGERRLQAALTGLDVERVGPEQLLVDPAVRAADPELASFRSANTPDEWVELEAWLAAHPGHRRPVGFLDSTGDPSC